MRSAENRGKRRTVGCSWLWQWSRVRRAVALPLALTAFLLAPRDARAFGGYFEQASGSGPSVGTVTDHRVAFSIVAGQTVLWDQMRFSGSPSDFAWVLPVRPGARVELSQDSWFAALDADSVPVVVGPVQQCATNDTSSSDNSGCGTSPPSGPPTYAYPDAGGDTVTVVSELVVGPYDAVTVRSSTGGSIGDWLLSNGYPVGPALQPILASYSAAGFEFLALKMRPGVGVQATQPIRVVTPGSDTTLPLRMLAAGTGGRMGIELFVLSTGPYEPANFPSTTLDQEQLVWDYGKQQSNYESLAQGIFAAGAGTTWLTESSEQDVVDPDAGATGLGALYVSLCQSQPVAAQNCTGPADSGGLQDGASGSSEADTNAGELDAADGGALDAADGGVPDAADVGTPASDSCLASASCDDYDVATSQLGGALWITRLRASLPAAALVTDLTLTIPQGNDQVLRSLQAYQMTDPYSLCADDSEPGDCSSTTRRSRPRVPAALVALAAVCVALEWRRRRSPS
jgi:hypothetical protein